MRQLGYQFPPGYELHRRYYPMQSCPGNSSKSQYQAVRDTLDVISGRWKLLILSALFVRPFRFRELSREIGITPCMLAKELQELEQHQLVRRTVYQTRPITVEYACTAHTFHDDPDVASFDCT